MKLSIYLLCCCACSLLTHAQIKNDQAAFWRLYAYSGEIKLNGFYRDQTRLGNQFKEKQQSTVYAAGLLLKLKNYIWTPRFIMLDLEGEYMPDKANEKYLVMPEQTENRDLRKFDIRLAFLPQNKLSSTLYYSYGTLYNNRENLSSVKLSGSNWGASMLYRTKKWPLSLAYTALRQTENEIYAARSFQNRQENLELRTNHSFGKSDRNEWFVSYNYFRRTSYLKNEVNNLFRNAGYSSTYFFGKKKLNSLNTVLSSVWQTGNDINTRYQAIENISLQLRPKLRGNIDYNYFSDRHNSQSLNQHKAGGYIQHQLYESLQSSVGYDYTFARQSQYKTHLHYAYGDFNYTKRILKKHQLDLSYRINLQQQKWNSQDQMIDVLNEIQTLSDGSITLLSHPYVFVSSIQVKDPVTGIPYNLNSDYILMTWNQYIQIQRVPGGLIPNNSKIWIDYTAIQPGNYTYMSKNQQLNVGLLFFKRLVNVYYRQSKQDYSNLKQVDFVTLNYYRQQVVGLRLEYKGVSGGAEYENMHSTVLPYELIRYFITLQTVINKKLDIALNGNMSNYLKLNDLKNLQFLDIYGSVNYRISPTISLKTSASHRIQSGLGVDLKLMNLRSEAVVNYKKLRISAMYNYYNRALAIEKVSYNAFQLQVARKF